MYFIGTDPKYKRQIELYATKIFLFAIMQLRVVRVRDEGYSRFIKIRLYMSI